MKITRAQLQKVRECTTEQLKQLARVETDPDFFQFIIYEIGLRTANIGQSDDDEQYAHFLTDYTPEELS